MGVKMKKVCWKDEYSVGVEKIDRQHRHLFEIINKLIDRSGSSEDLKLVSETLTEMLNYAKEHFTTEEELMQEYGYPEIESHKEQHIYFFKTTAELSVNALNKQSMVYNEIVEFLNLRQRPCKIKCSQRKKHRRHFSVHCHTERV